MYIYIYTHNTYIYICIYVCTHTHTYSAVCGSDGADPSPTREGREAAESTLKRRNLVNPWFDETAACKMSNR